MHLNSAIRRAPWLALALAGCALAEGVADLISEPVQPAGARAAAMADANGAAGDDWSTTLVNPAGLAWLRRTEASVGVARRSADLESGYPGAARGSGSRNRTGFDQFGLAVPVPVFRGGLGWGAGVRDARRFEERGDWADGDWRLRNDLGGGLREWSIAVGMQLSPSFAGGLSLLLHDGSAEQHRQEIAQDGTIWHTVDKLDLQGIGVAVGGLWKPMEQLRAGLTIRAPWTLSVDWSGSDWIEEPNGQAVNRTLGGSDYELRVPAEFDLQLAWRERFWQVGVRWTWQDWGEAEIDELPLGADIDATAELAEAYRSVGTLRLGGEVWIPRTDLRLRAGGWLRNIAQSEARLTDDYVTEGDVAVPYDTWNVREESPRIGVSAGLGWVFDEAVSLDLAVSQESWELSWLEWQYAGEAEHRLEEKRTRLNVLVSLVYRY